MSASKSRAWWWTWKCSNITMIHTTKQASTTVAIYVLVSLLDSWSKTILLAFIHFDISERSRVHHHTWLKQVVIIHHKSSSTAQLCSGLFLFFLFIVWLSIIILPKTEQQLCLRPLSQTSTHHAWFFSLPFWWTWIIDGKIMTSHYLCTWHTISNDIDDFWTESYMNVTKT